MAKTAPASCQRPPTPAVPIPQRKQIAGNLPKAKGR